MTMIIVEVTPGDFIRLPKEQAEKLGYKEAELKPVLPEKNKAVKPTKAKKAAEKKAEPIAEEVVSSESVDE